VSTIIRDELDRTSGRFVRNLALSLSGGALLALLGAGAAHAQDASTASSGFGGTGTGDASALGNHSGSSTTQGGTISGAQGSVQVITQTGSTNNNGVAVANTGGNQARGNTSDNTASLSQQGLGGSGAAVNSGQAANDSDGVAFITTGDASAVGNQSTTTLQQTTSARGALGGILVLDQSSTVTNSGRAFAGTGGNRATGNDASTSASAGQSFFLDQGLGSDSGKATSSSDGRATIATGSASAMGNVSDTSVTQSSNGAAGGDGVGGGLVLIPQTAEVRNDGRARATTGGNTAQGDVAGDVDAGFGQSLGGGAPALFGDVPGVAANSADVSARTDGHASITTGDASAEGNRSTSNVSQTASSDRTVHGGVSLQPQSSTIVNLGRAHANTGRNEATGNDTDVAGVDGTQELINGTIGAGVASNTAHAAVDITGDATIATGDATAVGNRSTTSTSQSSEANASSLDIYPQTVAVANVGTAFAGTGRNTATGLEGDSFVDGFQSPAVPADGLDRVIVTDSVRLDNHEDGAATITTGRASAAGNVSSTAVRQDIDPIGLVLPSQTAVVINAGSAVALTGNNEATGDDADNSAGLDQFNELGNEGTPTPDLNIGLAIVSNAAAISNAGHGTASIVTGSASAVGNESDTTIDQTSTGAVEGIGLIVNAQVAAVLNAGVAVATTGSNTATGNASTSSTPTIGDSGGGFIGNGQGTELAPFNLGAGSSVNTLLLTASNAGSASNVADGTATIVTGPAWAAGNRSATHVHQDEEGTVSGIGAIVHTQVAAVANVGFARANTGFNDATGNESDNSAAASQDAAAGGNAFDPNAPTATTDLTAPTITLANSASATNASDGTASVETGAASAVGNASGTDIWQDPPSSVSGLGLVVDTQVAGVANIGLAVADSGRNEAIGNESTNAQEDGTPAAGAEQDAEVANLNGSGSATTVTAFGPVIAANEAEVGNVSDGTARIRTGAASAEGNVSTTTIGQSDEASVGGIGAIVNTQVAGVANLGVGLANSGRNLAIGNESDNSGTPGVLDGGPDAIPGAGLDQTALIGSENMATGADGDVDLLGGTMVAHNAGSATNSSDGTAQVGTGRATASGNHSSTTINQHQSSEVRDLGVDVSTQAAGVANVGLGVANSGLNAAIGNASGEISPTGGAAVPNQASATQTAAFMSLGDPPDGLIGVAGPAIASNEGQAANTSDGQACVCTGDATASGNISTTNLVQDLDTSVGAGAIVLTEAAGVLNAGVGLANTGLNAALGNISQNLATTTQTNTIESGLPPAGGLVGPQIVHSGGGATNASNGTGKVGTGKATATGNLSATNMTQAAGADSDFAVATLAGGTSNTGLGLANSGLNLGIGNASVNDATLTQTADGAGLVSSEGTASNVSDGSGLVGNPDCLVPGTPGAPGAPGVPGTASLPKTGGPLEVEAALGLMLLLAGFALRRKGAV
jgi:hypothetical protein